MPSITQIGNSWRALIRKKGIKDCKTFPSKLKAQQWAKQREAEIDSAGIVADVGKVTVKQALQAYRKMRDESNPISSTSNTHYMLQKLETELGHFKIATMQPNDLVNFAKARKDEGAGPYTINMDISQLSTALRYAASAMNKVFPDVVGQARPLLHHLKLIGPGNRRERRSSEDETMRIYKTLVEDKGLVYAEAFLFSIASTMRRSEYCRILWDDVDRKKRMVLVRQRKHPRKKEANDEWVPLLDDAWKILNRQPKVDARIFPIHPQTLSKYFKEAREKNGIGNLRLHDMRHEGTSRLFDYGYEIQQVALVTGHKKWETLKIYTNLKPESLTTKKVKPKPLVP